MKDQIVLGLILLFVAVTSLLFFCMACFIWLATVLFDKKLQILHQFSSLWASTYLWILPFWDVSITGRENYDKRKAYVIISNHQSQLDILIAFRLFIHFKWVSKAEVFKIPFIGWNMYLNRYIKLKRGDAESIKKMYDRCEELIYQGNSIFLFPEGTRSENGRLKSFKHGAFILAQKTKRPILPVIIEGTYDALPKHSLYLSGRHNIKVKFLPEVSYNWFKEMNPEQLSDYFKELYKKELKVST